MLRFFPAHAQLHASAVVSYLNLKSFGQYAAWVNQNPDVAEKLGSFGPAFGYSIGLEPPYLLYENASFGFNFRNQIASVSMESGAQGRIDYNLRFDQYLMPFTIGAYRTYGESTKANLFNFILGLSSVKLTQDFGAGNFPDIEYKRMSARIGLGFSIVRVRNKVGFMCRGSYIGNLLPRYDDQLSLMNGSNYLKYRFEGKEREVKADPRGFNLETGVMFLFVR